MILMRIKLWLISGCLNICFAKGRMKPLWEMDLTKKKKMEFSFWEVIQLDFLTS